MADLTFVLPLFVAALMLAVAVWALTWPLLRLLRKRNILDQPNQRSSHVIATPKGGGLVLVPAVCLAWAGAALHWGMVPPGFWPVLAGALVLAAVSWADDLKNLPVLLRLGAQGLMVAVGVTALGAEFRLAGGYLPLPVDRVLTWVLWLWFVNLFNFMDGIDGITGMEPACLAAGLAIVAALLSWGAVMMALPVLLLGATLGFLAWNWPPAKLFMGDVGSVPLGFLLAWLLLLAVDRGQWAVALILPLYYWSDSGLTLARRVLRGEKFWRAHKEHLYQRAVQQGKSHLQVVCVLLLCNLVLIVLGVLSVQGHSEWALLGGIFLMALLWLGPKAWSLRQS